MSKRKRKPDPVSKANFVKEIEDLNKEISRLESELAIKERRSAETLPDKSLARIIAEITEGNLPTRTSRKSYNEEQKLNSLLSRVAKLESLTGLKFDEDKTELISPKDDNNNNSRNIMKWRRILSGECFSLPFVIELETEEILEEASSGDKEAEPEPEPENITVRVINLSIQVKCPLATRELSTFIATAEQEKAIATTFLAVKQYGKWYDYRQKTFQHFKAKFPDLIRAFDRCNRSDTMEVRNKLNNGLHFIIQWSIKIRKNGHVLPQIDAFVTCPNKICASETESVLNSTPQHFRKMVSTIGIEQAIECIIMIVQQ